MALTCGNCGAKVELSDEQRHQLAGKFFACPECGVTRRLRPKDAGSESGAVESLLRQRFQPPKVWKPAVLIVALLVSASVMALAWNWTAQPAKRDILAEKAREQRPLPAVPKRKVAAKPAPAKADAVEVAEKPVDPPKPVEDVKAVDRSLLRRAIDAVVEPARPPIVSPPRGSAPDLANNGIDDGMLKEVRELLRTNLPTGQWDEIAWWPSRYLEAGGHRRLMGRMKIRTTNRLGALDVMDLLFVVDAAKGEIRIAVPGGIDDDFATGGRAAFDRGVTRVFTTQDAVFDLLGIPNAPPPQPARGKK